MRNCGICNGVRRTLFSLGAELGVRELQRKSVSDKQGSRSYEHPLCQHFRFKDHKKDKWLRRLYYGNKVKELN